MNKKEFIRNVAKRSGYSQAKTTEVLDAVLAEMFEAWADHKSLEFRGFGAFYVKKRAAKVGRNATTGEKIDITLKDGTVLTADELRPMSQTCGIPEDAKLSTTGCDRTGCMFCMFGCHREKEPNRFQQMKITHPTQYAWCMKPVEEGGLGLDEVLNFIHIPH